MGGAKKIFLCTFCIPKNIFPFHTNVHSYRKTSQAKFASRAWIQSLMHLSSQSKSSYKTRSNLYALFILYIITIELFEFTVYFTNEVCKNCARVTTGRPPLFLWRPAQWWEHVKVVSMVRDGGKRIYVQCFHAPLQQAKHCKSTVCQIATNKTGIDQSWVKDSRFPWHTCQPSRFYRDY